MIAFLAAYVTGFGFLAHREWTTRWSGRPAQFDSASKKITLTCLVAALWPAVVAVYLATVVMAGGRWKLLVDCLWVLVCTLAILVIVQLMSFLWLSFIALRNT